MKAEEEDKSVAQENNEAEELKDEDAVARFERIKAQFYKPETQMNDAEQLKELAIQ